MDTIINRDTNYNRIQEVFVFLKIFKLINTNKEKIIRNVVKSGILKTRMSSITIIHIVFMPKKE